MAILKNLAKSSFQLDMKYKILMNLFLYLWLHIENWI
jgi:hypothetical protein